MKTKVLKLQLSEKTFAILCSDRLTGLQFDQMRASQNDEEMKSGDIKYFVEAADLASFLVGSAEGREITQFLHDRQYHVPFNIQMIVYMTDPVAKRSANGSSKSSGDADRIELERILTPTLGILGALDGDVEFVAELITTIYAHDAKIDVKDAITTSLKQLAERKRLDFVTTRAQFVKPNGSK